MSHATTLTDDERRDLLAVAGAMLPASAEFGVPGADDAVIFADIERSLGRDFNDVRSALAALRVSAESAFADLRADQREDAASRFLNSGLRSAAVLARVVLQCYYRDDRVVRSLGFDPRPPFPLGHTLEQGDWSLLDAVRGRAPMWRDV